MKQNANKNEIFWAGPHLAIINLVRPFLAIIPILQPLKTMEAFWLPGVPGIIKWGYWLEMDQYKQVPNQCYVII